MSMSLEDFLEYNYFPYQTKEELLETVKKWTDPEAAADYINSHYDTSIMRKGHKLDDNPHRVEQVPTFVGAKKRLFKKQKSLKGSNFTPPKKKRK